MRQFLIKISYTVLPLWLLLVGSVVYVSLYVSPRASGDLGALAGLPFGHDYDRRMAANVPADTLFVTVEKEEELARLDADVLTIGDSFSQQGAGGYQNFLAHGGLRVANCSWRLFSSPLQYAYNLLEQGVVDSTTTRMLVVEVCERLFQIEVLNFSPGRPNIPRAGSGGSKRNEWSLSRARDMLLYRAGMNPSVRKARLSRDLFSSDEPSTLYFYNEDISNGVALSPAAADKAKAVQAQLRQLAAQRGVKVVWMVPNDKYSLYQDYIEENVFPRKTVIDDIARTLDQGDDLLLTRRLLMPMVERGEKDVYLFNDSHWSHKATKAVAAELRSLAIGH